MDITTDNIFLILWQMGGLIFLVVVGTLLIRFLYFGIKFFKSRIKK